MKNNSLDFFYSRSNIFLFSERTIKFQNIFFAKKLSFRIEVETFFLDLHPSLYGFYSKALLLDPVQREA